jgi:hypothetical protein
MKLHELKDFIIATLSESTFDDVVKNSSRFRPHETVIFIKPIVGINGNKLISYQWAYEWTMKHNYEGELVNKRVSDWTQAEASADTGKDIVHKFTIEKEDGTYLTVSSESVPILLGYTDRAEMKKLPSIVSSVKTLAKQRMLLAILKAQEEEYNVIKKEVETLKKPKIEIAKLEDLPKLIQFRINKNDGSFDDVTYWKMGTVIYKQYDKNKIPDYTTTEQLNWDWESEEIKNRGGKAPKGIYELERKIERQERKVEDATGSRIKIK